MDALEYWRWNDELTVGQAALLAVGIDPSSGEGTYCETLNPDKRPRGYEAAKTAIGNALRNGQISGVSIPQTERDWNGNDVGEIEGSIDVNYSRVQVDTLRRWLASRGMKTGFFFPEVEVHTDYLDQTNPRFSAKLAAAVLAWQAMEDENLRRGKTPMTAMANWLEANYKALGLMHKRDSDKHGYKAGDMNKTAIAEAAKISNWEVDGGSPSTPSASSD